MRICNVWVKESESIPPHKWMITGFQHQDLLGASQVPAFCPSWQWYGLMVVTGQPEHTHSGVGIIVTPSKRHPKLARKIQQMGFLQIFWSETFIYLPFKVRSENSHIPPSTWLPHQLWCARNTTLVLPTPTRFASCGCGSIRLTYNQRFWLVKLVTTFFGLTNRTSR